MECLVCGNSLHKSALRLRNTNGTPRPISFCCYEHYLKFWADVGTFVPLPEYTKDEIK